MVKIGIVDDEKEAREQLRKEIGRFAAEYHMEFEVCEFDSAASYLSEKGDTCDILYLDIDMPQMSGMELAEKIRETDTELILIFCTNLQQFALNGYSVSALGFLVKPVQWYSFHLYLDRALKVLRKRAGQAENPGPESIVVKDGAVSRIIRAADIKYVEVRQHHVPSSVPPPWRLLLYTVLLVLLIWVCFDCNIIHAVFSATCAYAVQHITSKLTYMVIQLLLTYGSPRTETVFLLLLLSNVLVCLPIFLGFTRRFLREGQLMFDRTKTVIYSGLFLVVAAYLSFLLENNLDRTADTYLTSYLALNAFCVLFAAAVLSMEFSNCSIKRLENENMILEQQYTRAPDGERGKLEAEMKALKLCYYTGNKALDIVLTQKASLCEDAGVQLVCSADGSCLSGMTHYHIYSLLGNAIDNAIECLAKVDDAAKKVISLTLSRRGDMAVICIENYTPGPPVLRDGVLVTTKQDASGHGYGVKSIKNIAELYGGTADYFVEDGIFYLLVTLPCIGADARPSGAAAG